MKNFIQAGDTLVVTAPANKSSGDGILVGSIFGVAVHDALSGADLAIKTTGVFELPKVGSQAWAVGDPVYWDAGNGEATKTAESNQLIGFAVAAVGSGAADLIGRIRLAPDSIPSEATFPVAANVAPLADDSGGSATGTIAAIDDALTGVDGDGNNAAPLAGVNTQIGIIANALASLAAKQEAIIDALIDAGLMADDS